MNSIHLHENPVWFEIDPQSQKQGPKELLIIDPEEDYITVTLFIIPGEQGGENQGKCCIKVSQDVVSGDMTFQRMSASSVPASKVEIGTYNLYLDEYAFDRIDYKSTDYGRVDCVLQLSE